MSELFDASNAIMGIRRQLLISACAAALLTSVALQDTAAAESSSPADVPTLWLSVDAQAEQLSADNETFAPAFFTLPHAGPHAGAGLGLQRPPQLGFDLNVEALVQPQNSDWSFKASLKYGRALSEKKLRLTAPLHYYTFGNVNQHPPYYNGDATSRDSHAIVDFKAGRDLGIGLLGTGSQSSINFGVRFAQLQSRSHFHATSGYLHGTFNYLQSVHNIPQVDFTRSFRGVGPSISWDGDVPVAGDRQNGELSLDWGINGAVLFGRQKVQKRENSVYHYYARSFPQSQGHNYPSSGHEVHQTLNRSRSVVVLNPGAFAGISYRLPNAMLSIGYRADFFLGAIDGGVDTHKSYDRGFYGPFAKITVGLGR